jgi:hypothetical protein
MSKGIISDILLDIHCPDIHRLDAGLGILIGVQSNPYPEDIALVDNADRVLIQSDGVGATGHQIYLRRPRRVVVQHHGNIIGRNEILLFTGTRLGGLNLETAIEQIGSHLRIGDDDVTPSLIGAEAVLCRIASEVGLENEFGIVDDNESRFIHSLHFSFDELI